MKSLDRRLESRRPAAARHLRSDERATALAVNAATGTAPPPTTAQAPASPPHYPLVLGASVAFAGLLIYLSPVLYPLAILAGVYVLMQQQQHQHQQQQQQQGSTWEAIAHRLRGLLGTTSSHGSAGDEGVATKDGAPASGGPAIVNLDDAVALANRQGRQTPLAPVVSSSASADRSTATTTTTVASLNGTRPRASGPTLRVVDVGVSAGGAPRISSPPPSRASVVEPNTLEPYEFENEYVKGKLLFLLQRKDSDESVGAPMPSRYVELFAGKRRLFWVQMQVQFKKVPTGILYIGGEVPNTMNLGFFTGGLTKIILTVLQSLVRGLHCGFGRMFPDAVDHPDDEELPHICFPLYTAVDQFVVTPPGGDLPVLGSEDFGESKEAMIARRKSGQPLYQYNTRDTYSFHFHSFFIDFSTWRLVGVPGIKDCGLNVFWEDMPLRICAYNLKAQTGVDPTNEADAKKATHSWRAKEYKFCFQLSHKIQESIDEEGSLNGGSSRNDRRTSEVQAQLVFVQQELARFDFSIVAWLEYFSYSPVHSERRVAYVFRIRESVVPRSAESGSEGTTNAGALSEYVVFHTAVAAFSPLSCIEHNIPLRRRGSRTGIFSGGRTRSLEEMISVRSRNSKYTSIEEERAFLDRHLSLVAKEENSTEFAARPDYLLSARLALLDLLQNSNQSISREWPFLSSSSVRSNSFGSSTNVFAGLGSSPTPKDAPHEAVQVIRVLNAKSWRQEWASLDRTQGIVRFFRLMSSVCTFSIALDSVLVVEEDDCIDRAHRNPECALFWLRVGLFEKCHHIAFASQDERSQWRASVLAAIQRRGSVLQRALELPLAATCERAHPSLLSSETLSKSKGAMRLVLNDRCEFALHNTSRIDQSDVSPTELIANLLRRAIKLHQLRLSESSTHEFLVFHHDTGSLKKISLRSVFDDEHLRATCLFNLYHLMLIHASLFGLLPKSKTQWSKFFNGISYCVSGMHLSVAELEHCLIRAPMAPLRIPFASFVIPRMSDQDERARLRLTRPDWRFNFAMNCLTKSCPNTIPVFDPIEFDSQLDRIVEAAIDVGLSYDRESKTVYLPKVCDWYGDDFVGEGEDAQLASPTSIMKLLQRHLTGPKAQLFNYLLQNSTAISKWRYTKYDYRFHEAISEVNH